MFFMRSLNKILIALVILAGAAAFGFYWWTRTPVAMHAPQLDIAVKPHSSMRSVAGQLQRGGLDLQPILFEVLARGLNLAASIKSGDYEFKRGVTPYEVLQKLARGDVNQAALTVVEGWTLRRMRAEVDADPLLKHDTAALSDQALMAALGQSATLPEGMFSPDTYTFDKGSSDLALYRRAYRLGQQRLADAWAGRAEGLPYRGPYDVLIMASIIEKETGKSGDRPLVAAVFINRLKKNMPLQTDPAVIYGMGMHYAGALHKRDLQTDGPYNTYLHAGLPPTPIALPGVAALNAAVHPAASDALYFVARKDGTSVFSNNLVEHNRAVNKFIRGQ